MSLEDRIGVGHGDTGYGNALTLTLSRSYHQPPQEPTTAGPSSTGPFPHAPASRSLLLTGMLGITEMMYLSILILFMYQGLEIFMNRKNKQYIRDFSPKKMMLLSIFILSTAMLFLLRFSLNDQQEETIQILLVLMHFLNGLSFYITILPGRESSNMYSIVPLWRRIRNKFCGRKHPRPMFSQAPYTVAVLEEIPEEEV